MAKAVLFTNKQLNLLTESVAKIGAAPPVVQTSQTVYTMMEGNPSMSKVALLETELLRMQSSHEPREATRNKLS